MVEADLFSPLQVARAFGVSESSLKRWCDRGLIQTVRTAGGHRRLAVADVLRLAREQNRELASPDALGLPATSPLAGLGLRRNSDFLLEALLSGDAALCRQIIFNLIMAKHPLAVIFDEVVATAFAGIGDRWTCGEADPYQERRGVEIMMRTLVELQRSQRANHISPSAYGGTIIGDHYTLPTTFIETLLRDQGLHAMSLGTSLPFRSLAKAVVDLRPPLFWLSVSHIPDHLDFAAEFTLLSTACQQVGSKLIVGGRALTPQLRLKLAGAIYCETMQELAEVAQEIIRSDQKEKKQKQTRRKRPAKTRSDPKEIDGE